MLPHQKGDDTISCNIRGARMVVRNSEPSRNHENAEREFEFDKVRPLTAYSTPRTSPRHTPPLPPPSGLFRYSRARSQGCGAGRWYASHVFA